ncbi:MAG: ATP-binding protein [Clostridiales bacterium]|nr:ATP-binding protein [Clostridiales bacterium]
MKELTIPATVENIEKVTEFVNSQLEEINCPIKAKMQIDIAIDELFGNIAHYAYNPEMGPATVRVEVTEAPISVIVTFIDHGIPYDPLKKDDPDVTLSAEERAIGGLGIFMVKKTMDEITYEYKDGQNILSIRKDL